MTIWVRHGVGPERCSSYAGTSGSTVERFSVFSDRESLSVPKLLACLGAEIILCGSVYLT